MRVGIPSLAHLSHISRTGNPHFLVGALDEKALRGLQVTDLRVVSPVRPSDPPALLARLLRLQARGIQSFLIDSGLTTNDYGWGT